MKTNLLFLFLLMALSAAGKSYVLYSSDNDLTSTLITRLYQDSNNMIWVATENGLNRFDGSKFVKYNHEPKDSSSLCDDYVYALCEDGNGNLLIGTHRGIQIHNSDTDTFGPVSVYSDGKPFRHNIRDLLPLSDTEFLVSGDVLGSVKIEQNVPVVTRLDLLKGIATDKLLKDNNGNIWISSEKNGLYRKSPDGRIHHYFADKSFSLIDMVVGADGILYIAGIDHGLYRYDPSADKFILIVNNAALPINNLTQGKNNELLIATDGRGLLSYNYLTKQTSEVIYNMNSFDFSKAKIHSVIVDNADNIWLGIFQRGVMMVPKQIGHFRYIGRNSMDKEFVGANSITAFCRLQSGDMLVGTDNDGIYSIASDFSGSRHFAPGSNNTSVPAIVQKLFVDSDGNVWVGAYNDGLSLFDYQTGTCRYITGITDSNGNGIQGVSDIIEDGEYRLWIATHGGGIFYSDRTRRQFYQWKSQSGEGVNNWANCLAIESDGELIAGTYNGVYTINTASPALESGKSLPGYIVYDVLPGKDGVLWVATSSGLLRWNRDSNTVATFTTVNGLPGNSVYALECDGEDNLWLSTNNGIAKMSIATESFTCYFTDDGLQGNEFSKNASFKESNGMLWFGGINGITYFNPQIIKDNTAKWNIRLIDFYFRNGERVRAGVRSGGKVVTDRQVLSATDFYLSYEDNSFTMEFAPIEYDAPQKIVYEYDIDGEEPLSLPPGMNRIYVDKLAAGDHEIRVRAMIDGNYSDEKIYHIHISCPWWRSWWAWLLYAIVLAFIGYVIWRQKNLIEAKQQELREQRIKETIKDEKLKFLINITHEIRTPLSLITGPLNTIMKNDSDSGRQRIYQTILRNADRILNLVNQLLDLRKLDAGKLSLQFSSVDLVEYINSIINLFEERNASRNIIIRFCHPTCETLPVWISPDYFDKVIVNILSNAYKYTPVGGFITITLKVNMNSELPAPLNRCAEIVIDDSGIGIAPDDLDKIFDRFYQSNNSYNNSKPGTGIGLDLSRSLVNLHYGSIQAGNNPDGGARFVVRLPLGCDHIPSENRSDAITKTSVAEKDSILLPPAPAEQVRPSKSRSKYRILVVEDDSEIRNYIMTELSPYYHVKECENGKEGLKLIFEYEPNLVVSDVMMPEIDGISLCREIKKNVNINHIPVILLTAKIAESDYIEGLDVGADAYITKPFTIEFLKKNIDSLLIKYDRLRNTFGNNQLQKDKFEEIRVDSPDEKLMNRIMKVINANIDNPDLTADMIADKVGLSRTHLYRKLKELTNQSTRDFVRNIRLTQAANLMRRQKYTVNEIARLVGFSDPNNFSTAFRKFHGIYPTEYMAQHHSVPKEE